jgi:hypothetical protein
VGCEEKTRLLLQVLRHGLTTELSVVRNAQT